MEWIIIAVVIAALVAIPVAARYEAKQVRARTRRHLSSGGKIGDAPDMTPRNGGGAGG